jgi:hypothetical protein
MKKLTKEEFCALHNAFHGEGGMFSGIDHPKQLVNENFSGEELMKFVNFCIKHRKRFAVNETLFRNPSYPR